MDFSQVNRVIIDGKEVRQIREYGTSHPDSSHYELWTKKPDGWHTV